MMIWGWTEEPVDLKPVTVGYFSDRSTCRKTHGYGVVEYILDRAPLDE